MILGALILLYLVGGIVSLVGLISAKNVEQVIFALLVLVLAPLVLPFLLFAGVYFWWILSK